MLKNEQKVVEGINLLQVCKYLFICPQFIYFTYLCYIIYIEPPKAKGNDGGVWACTMCTFENKGTDAACVLCTTKKPGMQSLYICLYCVISMHNCVQILISFLYI